MEMLLLDDSLTHSVFSMSSIMDYEIHMLDLSHFVHASLVDGAQPSDLQGVFLAKSSIFSVFPLTILDPCASAAPPLFLAFILRASLNILNTTIFPPLILLP